MLVPDNMCMLSLSMATVSPFLLPTFSFIVCQLDFKEEIPEKHIKTNIQHFYWLWNIEPCRRITVWRNWKQTDDIRMEIFLFVSWINFRQCFVILALWLLLPPAATRRMKAKNGRKFAQAYDTESGVCITIGGPVVSLSGRWWWPIIRSHQQDQAHQWNYASSGIGLLFPESHFSTSLSPNLYLHTQFWALWSSGFKEPQVQGPQGIQIRPGERQRRKWFYKRREMQQQ